MQIVLIRPPARQPSRPSLAPPRRGVPPVSAISAAPTATAPIAPLVQAPAPKALDARQMTDQELLNRAGPRPNIGRVFANEARQPMFSRPLGRPPDDWGMGDCKPASEHSNRKAPPCFVHNPDDQAGRGAADARFAEEAHDKAAVQSYMNGASGASGGDYPGLSCVLLHHCKP